MSALPHCYRDRNGTFYGRYVFTQNALKLLPFLTRDIRCSLWTKSRREAQLRVRWFMYQIDQTVGLLLEMDDENEQLAEFQRQTEEVRQHLQRSAENLPAETALLLQQKLAERRRKESLAAAFSGYADELEQEARQVLHTSELQAETIQRLGTVRGRPQPEVDLLDDRYRSADLTRARRLVSQLESFSDRAEESRVAVKNIDAEIPEIGLSRVIEAQHDYGLSVQQAEQHPECLSEIAERFLSRKQRKLRNEKDINDLKRKVMRFIELLGDPQASDLTVNMVENASNDAANLPREQGKAHGLHARKQLELGLPPRSIQTTNNQLHAAKEFLAWAYQKRHVAHDYSTSVELWEAQKEHEQSKRRSWELEELQTIFNSYIYR